ncbi:MAG TPA: hypothetical protein VEA40_27920 [Ramlibacter sp.]|nr:hypothetical protein [Ramlibacter sp.]
MRTGRMALAACVAAWLVGCGGSGGGGTAGAADTPAPPAPAPAATSTPVAVTVIDGPLRNALVCLDRNRDGHCNADEPSARTGAGGLATLQVAPEDAGRFPVIAVVGTDAQDEDHGPVATAFVLKAPADRPGVVSPLTTLVQATVDATGAGTQAAEAALRAQVGTALSLFEDFTRAGGTEAATLRALARLIVASTQQQSAALGAVVGSAALDGAQVARADLDRILAQRVLEVLPTLVGTLADANVQAAISGGSAADIDAALRPLVATAAASIGLTTTTVATRVAVARQAAEPAATPTATASLQQFNFTDPHSWTARYFTSTAEQNAPDAEARQRNVERRLRQLGGVGSQWSRGVTPGRQADLHWNGSTWRNCPLNFENTSVRLPDGRIRYNSCDGFEQGVFSLARFDVAGRPMAEVLQEVFAAGYRNLTVQNAATTLGSATFPAGSVLQYQNVTVLENAPHYAPNLGSIARVGTPAVAAGNASAADLQACTAVTAATPPREYLVPATTLEQLVAGSPGRPCHFPPTEATGPRNEWWIPSTLSIGVVTGAPAAPGSHYTNDRAVRVAFGPANSARYYTCRTRASDASIRNCDLAGTGTYTIGTLGDARVLTLGNPPPIAASLAERVFIERGGKVWLGSRNRFSSVTIPRLNLVAANALLQRVAAPAIDPAGSFSYTRGSYQGEWQLWTGVHGEAGSRFGFTVPAAPVAGPMSVTCLNYTLPDAAPAQRPCQLTIDAGGQATIVDLEPPGSSWGTWSVQLDMETSRATGTLTPPGGAPQPAAGQRRN